MDQKDDLFGGIEIAPKIPQAPNFARFWEVYPRKVAKGAAMKAWEKATKGMNRPELEEFTRTILNAIHAQKKWREQSRSDPGIHVPDWKHPATWLNGMCWEDELESIVAAGSRARELGPCKDEGCENLVHGPAFDQCAYHYSMSAPSRRERIFSSKDLRDHYARNKLARRGGESIEEWKDRLRRYRIQNFSGIGRTE